MAFKVCFWHKTFFVGLEINFVRIQACKDFPCLQEFSGHQCRCVRYIVISRMFYLAVVGILNIRLRLLNRLLLVLLQDGRGDEGLDLPLEHIHVAGVVLVFERTFHLGSVGVLDCGGQTEPEENMKEEKMERKEGRVLLAECVETLP